MTDGPADEYVRSIARGLLVMEILGRPPGRHTMAQVAAAADLNRATARRVLATLVKLHYAEQDERYYCLRPRALGLGMAYLGTLPFWGYARRSLEALRDELKETTAIAVLDETEIVYVLREPAREILPISLGIGSRLPAHLVSLGHILLAFLSPGERDTVLSKIDYRRRTPHSVATKTELRRELEKVRRQGYAWVDGQLDPAICGMAVPIIGDSDKVIAALSANAVSGSVTEAQARARFLPRLREAAQVIRAHATSIPV